MPFKTMLAVIGTKESDELLHAAINLSGDANSHLSVLVVALAAPPPVGDYAAVISDAWMEEREADIKLLETRLERVRATLSNSGISFDANSLYSEVAWADDDIGVRALYADLVLLGTNSWLSADLRRQTVGGALFNARRPLLLLPDRAVATLQPERVLVAWDSSPDAASAVRQSIAFLASADSVHVTIVDPQSEFDRNGEQPGAEIATYLARHGAKVTIDLVASAGRPVADVLKQHAVDISADMIVMGAYGHSRMRERILGGVTQSMLDDPAIPVFMAH